MQYEDNYDSLYDSSYDYTLYDMGFIFNKDDEEKETIENYDA